jgi:hypothetical protein
MRQFIRSPVWLGKTEQAKHSDATVILDTLSEANQVFWDVAPKRSAVPQLGGQK